MQFGPNTTYCVNMQAQEYEKYHILRDALDVQGYVGLCSLMFKAILKWLCHVDF